MFYRIFISFTSKDREIKDALVEKLNELNTISTKLQVKIWEMDTGCYGRWDLKCSEELHKSDFVISILSENVKENSVVYDEIAEAKKLCDERSLEFMPVILCEQKDKDEFKNYTRINAVGKDITECIQMIYDKLEENITAKLKQPLTSEACVRVRSKDNNQHFFGREQELKDIKELFKDNNIVVLTGVGGIGKTELAKEFARRNKDEFTDSYIISYSLPPHTDTSDGSKSYNVEDLICSLQFEKTPDTNNIDELYRINLECLKSIDRKTLLIIDGYDIGIDQVKGLINVLNSCSCRFMFTSRHETTTIVMKEIKPMNDENIIELFRGYYNLDYGTETVDKKEITDDEILSLAQAVDYHTLTVSLMSRLLRTSRKVDVERLKNVFDVKSKVYNERTSNEETIYNHIESIFDLSELSEFKKQTMAILCRVCSYGIDFDSLDNILKIDEETENDLKELVSSGLVKLENDTYSLHMVISEVAYRKLDVDNNQECDLLDWIAHKLQIDEATTIENKIQCLQYGIFYISERIKTNCEVDNYKVKLANIYHNTGYLFKHIGDYDEALKYYFKALEIREQVLGPKHPDTATSYNDIGVVYDEQGNYDEALKYYFKGLEIQEQVLGPKHPSTATSYNNIGVVYDDQGNYDEALKYYFKALEIREQVLGPKHPNTATLYNNIGVVYDEQGNYDEALKYYFKALEIREQVLGPKHPDTATTYNNIGLVYKAQGNYDESLKYYFKGLEIQEQVLGPKHPDTATTYNNIGLVYKAQGNYDEALKYYFKDLAIYEQVLGPKHPDTATTYNNIGVVYDEQGNYDEALKYYFKALEIREQVSGLKHPSTAISYNNIGAVHDEQGNYDEALKYYFKGLEIQEQVLGPKHPSTATSYNNIGLVYYNQGKYDEALKCHLKALAIFEQVLGPKHPSTATSYNNIGLVYYNQGKYDEALKCHLKALAIFEQVFGPKHPSTASIYFYIGYIYLSKKENNQVKIYFKKALIFFEEKEDEFKETTHFIKETLKNI